MTYKIISGPILDIEFDGNGVNPSVAIEGRLTNLNKAIADGWKLVETIRVTSESNRVGLAFLMVKKG